VEVVNVTSLDDCERQPAAATAERDRFSGDATAETHDVKLLRHQRFRFTNVDAREATSLPSMFSRARRKAPADLSSNDLEIQFKSPNTVGPSVMRVFLHLLSSQTS
jgi:hypothetical protein